jgi:hypothetical protein
MTDFETHPPGTAAELERLKAENAALKRRYTWAANELLSCDYGDGPQKGGVGWIVWGWRVKNVDRLSHNECPRIYGASIDVAIDAAIDSAKGTQ